MQAGRIRGFRRDGGAIDRGRREVERRLFGTHQELLHSTGVRSRPCPDANIAI